MFASGNDVFYTQVAFVIVGVSAFASAYGVLRRSQWLTLSISVLFASQGLCVILLMVETSDYPTYLPVLLGPLVLFWWLTVKGLKKIVGDGI
jgi:hypothetical protein